MALLGARARKYKEYPFFYQVTCSLQMQSAGALASSLPPHMGKSRTLAWEELYFVDHTIKHSFWVFIVWCFFWFILGCFGFFLNVFTCFSLTGKILHVQLELRRTRVKEGRYIYIDLSI